MRVAAMIVLLIAALGHSAQCSASELRLARATNPALIERLNLSEDQVQVIRDARLEFRLKKEEVERKIFGMTWSYLNDLDPGYGDQKARELRIKWFDVDLQIARNRELLPLAQERCRVIAEMLTPQQVDLWIEYTAWGTSKGHLPEILADDLEFQQRLKLDETQLSQIRKLRWKHMPVSADEAPYRAALQEGQEATLKLLTSEQRRQLSRMIEAGAAEFK